MSLDRQPERSALFSFVWSPQGYENLPHVRSFLFRDFSFSATLRRRQRLFFCQASPRPHLPLSPLGRVSELLSSCLFPSSASALLYHVAEAVASAPAVQNGFLAVPDGYESAADPDVGGGRWAPATGHGHAITRDRPPSPGMALLGYPLKTSDSHGGQDILEGSSPHTADTLRGGFFRSPVKDMGVPTFTVPCDAMLLSSARTFSVGLAAAAGSSLVAREAAASLPALVLLRTLEEQQNRDRSGTGTTQAGQSASAGGTRRARYAKTELNEPRCCERAGIPDAANNCREGRARGQDLLIATLAALPSLQGFASAHPSSSWAHSLGRRQQHQRRLQKPDQFPETRFEYEAGSDSAGDKPVMRAADNASGHIRDGSGLPLVHEPGSSDGAASARVSLNRFLSESLNVTRGPLSAYFAVPEQLYRARGGVEVIGDSTEGDRGREYTAQHRSDADSRAAERAGSSPSHAGSAFVSIPARKKPVWIRLPEDSPAAPAVGTSARAAAIANAELRSRRLRQALRARAAALRGEQRTVELALLPRLFPEGSRRLSVPADGDALGELDTRLTSISVADVVKCIGVASRLNPGIARAFVAWAVKGLYEAQTIVEQGASEESTRLTAVAPRGEEAAVCESTRGLQRSLSDALRICRSDVRCCDVSLVTLLLKVSRLVRASLTVRTLPSAAAAVALTSRASSNKSPEPLGLAVLVLEASVRFQIQCCTLRALQKFSGHCINSTPSPKRWKKKELTAVAMAASIPPESPEELGSVFSARYLSQGGAGAAGVHEEAKAMRRLTNQKGLLVYRLYRHLFGQEGCVAGEQEGLLRLFCLDGALGATATEALRKLHSGDFERGAELVRNLLTVKVGQEVSEGRADEGGGHRLAATDGLGGPQAEEEEEQEEAETEARWLLTEVHMTALQTMAR